MLPQLYMLKHVNSKSFSQHVADGFMIVAV